MEPLDIDTSNILEFSNNIVYIEGNLVVDTDKLPLIGMQSMCFADEEYKQYATNVISGDLRITDENVNEYSSFTNFIVKGDYISHVCLDENLPYPWGNVDVYEDRKREFYQLLDKVDENTPQLMIQMLYASVFSRYEYSVIQNILFSFQYKMKEIDVFFTKENKNQIRRIKPNTPDRIKEFLYMEHIRGHIYAGDANFVRRMLFNILKVNIEFPEELSDGYKIRNSIVHRAGCNLNGYPIYLKKEDVLDIANIIDGFTDKIFNLFREDAMKQINSFRSQQGLSPL